MKKENIFMRILRSLLTKIGIMYSKEVSKREMCNKAQGVCDNHCESCAWSEDGKKPKMTYKEFVAWCNDRACDGCWGFHEAIICVGIMDDINKKPRKEREEMWSGMVDEIVNEIVDPINHLIEMRCGKKED